MDLPLKHQSPAWEATKSWLMNTGAWTLGSALVETAFFGIRDNNFRQAFRDSTGPRHLAISTAIFGVISLVFDVPRAWRRARENNHFIETRAQEQQLQRSVDIAMGPVATATATNHVDKVRASQEAPANEAGVSLG